MIEHAISNHHSSISDEARVVEELSKPHNVRVGHDARQEGEHTDLCRLDDEPSLAESKEPSEHHLLEGQRSKRDTVNETDDPERDENRQVDEPAHRPAEHDVSARKGNQIRDLSSLLFFRRNLQTLRHFDALDLLQ